MRKKKQFGEKTIRGEKTREKKMRPGPGTNHRPCPGKISGQAGSAGGLGWWAGLVGWAGGLAGGLGWWAGLAGRRFI